MKKIILVDGNNLLFRSYYATAYSGNFMNNSKGFPTNALFGFASMMNKIINEERPEYILVAFDKGKTFRHDKYDSYKGGRAETPNELKMQFPVAKEMLTLMGIKYYEIDNYEADDIIGTFSEFCNKDSEYKGTIISSDKDLLQLISPSVDIKLLKQKDYIRYNLTSFKETYGINPVNVIDLKALMGDSSDNIPGVKGVGEKTALKLLHSYKNLDGVYQNIDKISGKLKEKLIADKDRAYMSYDLATIVKDVPVDININDIIYKSVKADELNRLYEELEFYSLLKKRKKNSEECDIKIIENIMELNFDDEVAISLEVFGSNYHNSPVLGMGVYSDQIKAFVPVSVLKENPDFLTKNVKFTYDYKKVIVALRYLGVSIDNVTFDTMVAGSLLNYNVKDDMAYLANELNENIEFYENVFGKFSSLKKPDLSKIISVLMDRAKFIYETRQFLLDKLSVDNVLDLFLNVEMPLIKVLADMEFTGVRIDEKKLDEMGEEINIKLELLTKDIYNIAGCEFNIASPTQLAVVLFEKLGLPHKKKTKNGYSTAADVLNKLRDRHPIIDMVLQYRGLSKLHGTYIDGLKNYIVNGNEIHTIYTQNLTRTGRLSSIEPNLQNIPVRDENGKQIRKAFVPQYDYILSADYSQIELRILAHIAKVPALKQAFMENKDIHAKTASDIFNVPLELVTSHMRRMAKAVNFGIIYGISSFGLSENLDIKAKDAKEFIDTYLKTYPGIKEYMDNMIDKAREDGFVRTLFNRKRVIPELNNPNYVIRQSGERIALNTPIQGTSADIIKLAMVKVYEEFNKHNLKSKLIIQVHDELIVDVVKEELETVKKILIKTMENVYKLDVPLKVDVNYGNNWFEAK